MLGTGVKIVDVSDPAQPELVATVGAYPRTLAEDIGQVATRRWTGAVTEPGL